MTDEDMPKSDDYPFASTTQNLASPLIPTDNSETKLKIWGFNIVRQGACKSQRKMHCRAGYRKMHCREGYPGVF